MKLKLAVLIRQILIKCKMPTTIDVKSLNLHIRVKFNHSHDIFVASYILTTILTARGFWKLKSSIPSINLKIGQQCIKIKNESP